MKATIWYTALLALSTAIVEGAEMYSRCDAEDGWIPYQDEKCVKLFPDRVTRDQAEVMCNDQSSDLSIPTLVTIKSADEQQFLVEYVSKTSEFTDIWIGAKRRPDSVNEFDWSDGSSVEHYANWGEQFPTADVQRSCVHMTRSESTRGMPDMEWNDAPCNSSENQFICEKLQPFSINELMQAILIAKRDVQDVNNQIAYLRDVELVNVRNEIRNLVDSPFPIGYIYIQLHNQPEPSAMWSGTTWVDITSQFAGLFFRAVGINSGSSAFGVIQEESSPILRWAFSGSQSTRLNLVNIVEGDSSGMISTGEIGPGSAIHSGLSFHMNTAANFPRNAAMRVWRRAT